MINAIKLLNMRQENLTRKIIIYRYLVHFIRDRKKHIKNPSVKYRRHQKTKAPSIHPRLLNRRRQARSLLQLW